MLEGGDAGLAGLGDGAAGRAAPARQLFRPSGLTGVDGGGMIEDAGLGGGGGAGEAERGDKESRGRRSAKNWNILKSGRFLAVRPMLAVLRRPPLKPPGAAPARLKLDDRNLRALRPDESTRRAPIQRRTGCGPGRVAELRPLR